MSDGLHTLRGFLETGLSGEASDMSDIVSFQRLLRSAQASACSMPNVSWSPAVTLAYRTSGFHVHSYHQLQGRCSSLEVNSARGYNSGPAKGLATVKMSIIADYRSFRCSHVSAEGKVRETVEVSRPEASARTTQGHLRQRQNHRPAANKRSPALSLPSCCPQSGPLPQRSLPQRPLRSLFRH